MTLTPITTKQFIGVTVLITIAFGCLVYTQGKIIPLFNLPLLISMFVMMPSDISKRPLTRTNLIAVLTGLLLAAAFIWWCFTHRTPESEASGRSFIDSFSHPAVAVPLWLAFVYIFYRRWRVKPPLREEQPSGNSP